MPQRRRRLERGSNIAPTGPSGNRRLGRHVVERRRFQRIRLLIEHLTRVSVARYRAVDQRQQLGSSWRQDKVLTITTSSSGRDSINPRLSNSAS